IIDHAKGSNRAVIPITAELRAAIDAMPTWPQTSPIRCLTYLRTRHGRARSDKALTGDFRHWCNAAGLPDDCTLHGLRHTAAHLIAESGGTTHEIMSHTGHKSLKLVEHYTRDVDRLKLAARAFAKRSQGRAS